MLKYMEKAVAKVSPQRPLIYVRYGAGKCEMTIRRLQQILDERKRVPSRPDAVYLAIIFCGSNNVRTWKKELARLKPDWQVTEDTGPGFTPSAAKPGHIIHLVRHHRTRILVEQLIHHRPRALVWDETTAIKNPDAQITKAALRIAFANANQTCLRLGLSGDPNPESEIELWSQFQFAFGPDKNPLGMTYYAFLRHWFLKPDWHYILKEDLREQFYAIVKNHSVLFDQDDHIEFEKVTGNVKKNYRINNFETSKEQKGLLQHLDKTWSLPTEPLEPLADPDELDLTGTALEEYNHTMAILMKRQQIASGFYYVYKPDFRRNRSCTDCGSIMTPSGEHFKCLLCGALRPPPQVKEPIYLSDQPKAEMLASRIKSYSEDHGQRRFIVWYHFQASRPIISAYVHAPLLEVIGTSPAELDRFTAHPKNDPKSLVLAIPLSQARGTNDLAGVPTMFFYENVYKQEMRNQAEERITGHRAKGNKQVIYEDICAPDQLDSQIIAALWAKELTPAKLEAIVADHFGGPKR